MSKHLHEYFSVVGLMRGDLYDLLGEEKADLVSDNQMQIIAEAMSDNAAFMDMYWAVLEETLRQLKYIKD